MGTHDPGPSKTDVSRIPDFATREEEAEWFDTHDMGDYQDEFKTVRARFVRNLTEGLTIRFDKETEIAGFLKLRLWVEAKGANDMDLSATVKKLDANGQPLTQSTSANPFVGADGRLRVSQRQLDLKRSTPLEPVHTHKTVQLLEAGDIVPVEIQIWPAGIVFHAGEQLQLAVAGYDNVTEGRGQDRPRASPLNKGDHIIHTGGKYDSYLLAPVIPANRQSGGAAAAFKP